jgi:hypothetical protein
MNRSRENLLAIVLGVIFTVAIFAVIFLWGQYFSQTDEYPAQPSQEVSRSTPTPSPTPTPTPTQTPTPTPTGTPTPTPTKTEEPVKTYTEVVDHNVPFAAQAPLGHWTDLRQEHGCEEASVLMAMKWVNGQVFGSLASAEAEVVAMADFEQATYGMNYDTSAKDTLDRIIVGYFGYKKAVLKEDINTEDIKKELYQGNIVIVPMNGRALENPNFTPPGPTVHMLLVKGYDPNTNEFITNDPGTRRGKNYRYTETIIEDSLRDYATGFEEPIPDVVSKVMIVISK